MKIFKSIVIVFYTLVFSAVGLILIAYAAGLVTPELVNEYMKHVPTELNLRMIVGVIGGAIIVICLAILQLALGSNQSERTLAYDNPSGQVTVSLAAIEDVIRRISREFEAIKDMRPHAVVKKDGVHIACKTALYQDAPIPELTQNIQNTIKARIQKLLGIEEETKVRVDVIKILTRESEKSAKKEESPETPFQYEAKT